MLRSIRKQLFPEGSYFRVVNCGFNEEKDDENVYKFRYGIQKYVEDFVDQNPDVNTKDLNFMKNKFIFYFLPVPLAFKAIAQMSGRTGYLAIFGSIFIGLRCFQHYAYNKNLYYQIFLLKNFHNFDPNVQLALKTGDHRYIRDSLPHELDHRQLIKETDRLLFMM